VQRHSGGRSPWSTTVIQGDLATVSCGAESEAELAFAFALGMARRRVVLLVRNSPGVEQHELDCGQRVHGSKEGTRKRDPDSERQLSSRISGTAQVPREMNTLRN
jgi:hypothetical protein